MQYDYLKESRRLDALAQALCSVTADFSDTKEKDTAVAAMALLKLVLKQLDIREIALDKLAEKAHYNASAKPL